MGQSSEFLELQHLFAHLHNLLPGQHWEHRSDLASVLGLGQRLARDWE